MREASYKVTALVLVLTLAAGTADVLAFRYPISEFDELKGLVVEAIYQDSEGYVWLGTQTGVWRGQSNGFRQLDGPDTKGMATDFPPNWAAGTRCFLEDGNHTVWIGTRSGLLALDLVTLAPRPVPAILARADVWCLVSDATDRIFVGTRRGLFMLETGGGVARAVPVSGTEHLLVSSIVAGEDRKAWLGTSEGIFESDGNEPRTVHEGTFEADLVTLHRATDGTTWIGLRRDGGLYRTHSGTLARFSAEHGLLNDDVNAIVETPDGEIWVGTEAGVFRWNGSRFTCIDRSNGLDNPDVHSLMVDEEGQIWIGTYGSGVYRLRSPDIRIYDRGDGLGHSYVTMLAEESPDRILVGTGKGLFALDLRDERFTSLDDAGQYQFSARARESGPVWVATAAHVAVAGEADRIDVEGRLDALTIDARGRLLAGTRWQGLLRRQGDAWRPVHVTPDLGGSVTDLVTAPDGSIYAGLANGLAWSPDGDTWRALLRQVPVRHLCLDVDGTVWLGTADGLLRYRGGEVRPIPADSRAIAAISALCLDETSGLWVGTIDGLHRLRDGAHERFNLPDGLTSRDIRCLLPRAGGELWVGTTQGLARIDTNRLRPCETPPRVHIDNWSVDDDLRRSRLGRWEIPYAHQTVVVRVGCLGWRSTAGVRYLYRLEGRDEAWSAPTTQRIRHYANLPPGDYAFLARAVNARGIESRQTARMAFTILPPVWRQPQVAGTALGLVLLVALLSGGLVRKRAELAAARRRAAVAQQETERKFIDALRSSDDAVFLMEEDRILDCNETAARMLGLTGKEDLIGRSPLDLNAFAPAESTDSEQSAREMIATAFRHGTHRFESTACRGNGARFPVEISLTCIPFRGRQVLFGVWKDVSRRRGAEEKLRLQGSALDSAANGIVITDREGRIIWVNRAFMNHTGYTFDEVLGRNPRILRSGEHDPCFYRQMWKTITAGEVWCSEIINRRKNGSLLYEEMTITPVRNENGEITHFVAIKQDISRRKQAEQALRQSELKFRTLAETMPAAAFIHQDSRLRYLNTAAERMTGYSIREMLGMSFPDLIHPEDRERLAIHAQGGRNAVDSTLRHELRLRTSSGETRWIELAGGMIEYEGNPAVLSTAFDITDRKRAEDELRRTTAFLDSIVENIPDMIFVKDSESLRFVLFNKAGEKLLGYSRADMIGRNDRDFFPEEEALFFNRIDREVLDGGVPVEIEEEPVETRDNGTRILHTKKIPIFDEHGRPRFLMGISRDITEWKWAQERLKFTQFAVESAGDAVFWVRPGGRFMYVNDATCRWLGYSREELLEMGVHDVDRDLEETKGVWQNIVQHGSWMFNSHYTRKDGTIFPVEVTASHLSYQNQDYCCAFVRDITERERFEEALRASEEKYRSLFETSRDGIDFTDLDGRIQNANPALLGMLGYSMDELRGRTYRDLTPPHWEEMERAIIREQVMKRGYSDEYEKEYYRKDGTVFPIMIRVWLVRDADDRPCRMLGLIRDISDRKAAEALAYRRQAELAHALRLSTVGEMTANIAHELGQPLSVISNYASGWGRLLRAGEVKQSELLDALGKISAQSHRAGEVIRRIRMFLRKGSPQPIDVRINAIVREALELAGMDLRHNRVKLESHLTDMDPLVHVDPVQIQQVIINLVRNSIEAMHAQEYSRRRLEIRTVLDKERREVAVTVSDTGCGLPPDAAATIFDPFFTTKAEGMGLGLSTSRTYIKQYGGRIAATPNPAGGAEIQFTLPVLEEE